jgi:hypothetical protein
MNRAANIAAILRRINDWCERNTPTTRRRLAELIEADICGACYDERHRMHSPDVLRVEWEDAIRRTEQ